MKKMIRLGIFLSSLLMIGATAGHVFAAQAAKPAFDEKAVADFYRGKTVRIIVGFSAGGGYDAYSRVIARHLGKYIPGNPAIIVDNMAGAGSIIAANHVYNAAPKDGTVIGNISGPIILEQLFGNPAVQFDMAKLRYLAVPVSETYLMIVTRKPGVTKFEEVLGPKGKQVVIGAIPGSTVEHGPILVRDVLGANLRVVAGYKGTADVRMAIHQLTELRAVQLRQPSVRRGAGARTIDVGLGERRPSKDFPLAEAAHDGMAGMHGVQGDPDFD